MATATELRVPALLGRPPRPPQPAACRMHNRAPLAVNMIKADATGCLGLATGLPGGDLLMRSSAAPRRPGQLRPRHGRGRIQRRPDLDATRTKGCVSSHDLAPTIAQRLGLPIPAEIDGTAIRAEGGPDFGGVRPRWESACRGYPYRDTPRRTGLSLLTWGLVTRLAAALSRAGVGLRLLALLGRLPACSSCCCAPRCGPAKESNCCSSLWRPALAAASLLAPSRLPALAVACALTTLAAPIRRDRRLAADLASR